MHQIDDAARSDDVKARGDLVEDDDARIMDHRAHDRHLLAHPGRHLADAYRRVAVHVEQVVQYIAAARNSLIIEAVQSSVIRRRLDRKSTRLNSSHVAISYA